MTEQMTALAENYPAAAELLRRHGGETLLTYLGQLRHQPLPDILPSEDLLTEVRDYFTPFFGVETAGECADVLRRRRCLSTANHHHPAFEYMTVQDTILCDRWLRTQGETGAVVPFLSCANPRLDNNVYPRGMLVYDCTAPGRLPAAAVLSVQAAPRLCGRRGGHLSGHGRQCAEPPAAGDAARLLLASHSRRAGALLPRGPALRPCAALRHAAGTDHGHQRHALTAVLHRPRAAVPLDADGDAHRPSAGKRFSDGSRAHRSTAVPAGAARIASAEAGRRFRLLDGKHRRHALFLGARPPRGVVSSAAARERGRRRRWRVKTRWERL